MKKLLKKKIKPLKKQAVKKTIKEKAIKNMKTAYQVGKNYLIAFSQPGSIAFVGVLEWVGEQELLFGRTYLIQRTAAEISTDGTMEYSAIVDNLIVPKFSILFSRLLNCKLPE